jgi:DNA-binding MarR family transcriptional regulator
MRVFNQLKIEALMAISARPGSTSENISRDLHVSIESAQMVLTRCSRQKLLDRTTRPEGVKKPHFRYVINQRGLERLLYLQLKKGKETQLKAKEEGVSE